ncbi:tRNA-dihydrouridine(47) synthase [NAD(P)(+)]-like [Anolis carolinensis]|uniref:tRNA-dihydrouridine(47) synthase [NAD(P)(+)]-like n=1 Tax=Anolis carolinensis TaxID=28377 RepID=UPI002F2B2334
MEAGGGGVAPLKAQYLSTKEAVRSLLDREGESERNKEAEEEEEDVPEKNADRNDEEPRPKIQKVDDDGNQKAGDEDQSKPRRKRARGQNKSRPCMKPNHFEKVRLCPSVVQERTEKCFFGPRCRFLHDVEEYLATKPPDLGDRCVIFQTFGKCTYGATCRFAGAHFGPDRKNAVDAERVKEWEGKVAVRNGLSKELQQKLRKRKFPFEKAQEYLRRLGKGNAGAKDALDCKTIDSKAPDAEQMPNEDTVSPIGPDSEPPVDATLPKTLGTVTDEDVVKLRPCEKRKLDLNGKLYLAPLTTCGNLPFRRICKRYGADVTCGEMAVCTNLLQGQSSEWALLKRHHTEDLFGVQLEGAFPDTMTKCAELLSRTIEADFVDINVGCPIDLIYNKGGGCALMARTNKFEQIVRGMDYVLDVPLTVKIRTGVQEKVHLAHKVIPRLREWGAAMVTLHGRSREQRYTKVADWEYIAECAKIASPMPLFGNGDIFSFEDADRGMETGVSGLMIGRGALIKPWVFTEIKERRHWDISSSERLEILKDYTQHGLEHWGSDTQGVEKTRKFLLEWLSFLCRYIPAGLLERLPQRINERPPYYMGRDYMETLMASQNVGDWVKISEMLLGPVPSGFVFLPKHKANSYK